MLNSCQKLVGTCWNSVLVLNIFHWHFPTLKTSLKNPDPILIIWKSSIRYKVDTAVLSAWHDGAENFRFTEDILEHDSLDPPPGSEIFLKQPSMDSILISKGFQHFLDFRSPKNWREWHQSWNITEQKRRELRRKTKQPMQSVRVRARAHYLSS